MSIDTKELKTITLLYVEDDEVVRKNTVTLFEKIFKKVYYACDGKEGLDLFKTHQNEIEIIVSDINMPNMNGLEMIEHIKDIAISNVPTVLTTAHNDSVHLESAINLNVDKYIAKPVQVKELTVSIINLVKKYRKQKNIETLAKNMANVSSKTNKLQQNIEFKDHQIKHYKALIDNFVFQLDITKNGLITEASIKFCNFFGVDKSEIVDTNINDFKCHSCSGESFQQLMLKAIHTKKTVSTRSTFVTKDEASIDFDVIMTANYGRDSLVSGYTLYLDLV